MQSEGILLAGLDTVECAYSLDSIRKDSLDFELLAAAKADLQRSKSRRPRPIRLGTEEFLLASHGNGSGYPFLLENDSFSVQLGEFNKPNFFVSFRFVHSGFGKWVPLHCMSVSSLGLRIREPIDFRERRKRQGAVAR